MIKKDTQPALRKLPVTVTLLRFFSHNSFNRPKMFIRSVWRARLDGAYQLQQQSWFTETVQAIWILLCNIFFKKYLCFRFAQCFRIVIFHKLDSVFTQSSRLMREDSLDRTSYVCFLCTATHFDLLSLDRVEKSYAILPWVSVSFKYYSVNDPLLGEVNHKNKKPYQ